MKPRWKGRELLATGIILGSLILAASIANGAVWLYLWSAAHGDGDDLLIIVLLTFVASLYLLAAKKRGQKL